MSVTGSAAFGRCIGIDYSGAQTPSASLKGLRAYMADQASPPVEVQPPPGPRKYWTASAGAICSRAVQPPPGPRKYWTRRGLAEFFRPDLAPDEREVAGVEGWVLGVR